MTNELSGESHPNFLPLMPWFAMAPLPGVNPYDWFSAVSFNPVLSPA